MKRIYRKIMILVNVLALIMLFTPYRCDKIHGLPTFYFSLTYLIIDYSPVPGNTHSPVIEFSLLWNLPTK